MSMKQWCRHFTGVQNKTCKLGIKYEDVRVTGEGPFKFPCVFTADNCEKRESYTPEEIAARDREIKARLVAFGKARTAIIEHADGKHGVSGEIPCPNCGGSLRYSIARVNGHVHAACSTDDCVRWME